MQANPGAVVGAIMKHSTPGERLHNLPLAHECCYRQAAAERFPECRDIRIQLVILLTSPGCDPKSGNGLIENEKRAMLLCQGLEDMQVAILRWNHAHVRH